MSAPEDAIFIIDGRVAGWVWDRAPAIECAAWCIDAQIPLRYADLPWGDAGMDAEARTRIRAVMRAEILAREGAGNG